MPPATQIAETGNSLLRIFLENALALTILFIFLGAIIGAFVTSRRRDRCLKLFDDFPATLQRTSGAGTSGQIRVLSKGLIVSFDRPVAPAGVPARNSLVLYETELAEVLCLMRHVDHLNQQASQRRARQVRRMVRPPLGYRLLRRLRNIVNTLRDAFGKAFASVLGHMQRTRPSAVLTAGSGTINDVSSYVLTAVGNAYEPILELMIGQAVVAEVKVPAPAAGVLDVPGYLGEYSDRFLLLCDVPLRLRTVVPLAENTSARLDGQIQVRREGEELHVANSSKQPVRLVALQVGEVAVDRDVALAPGATETIDLESLARPDVSLGPVEATFELRCRCDLIVPRTLAAVRYAGLDADVTACTVVWPHPTAAPMATVASS